MSVIKQIQRYGESGWETPYDIGANASNVTLQSINSSFEATNVQSAISTIVSMVGENNSSIAAANQTISNLSSSVGNLNTTVTDISSPVTTSHSGIMSASKYVKTFVLKNFNISYTVPASTFVVATIAQNQSSDGDGYFISDNYRPVSIVDYRFGTNQRGKVLPSGIAINPGNVQIYLQNMTTAAISGNLTGKILFTNRDMITTVVSDWIGND